MTMKARHAPTRVTDTGFSLVELLMAAALIPVILSAAYLAFGGLSGNYSLIEATSDAAGEAQRGLDTLVRELRQAREITDGGGAFADASDTSCAFYCDADRDGAPELITYYVNDADLYRKVGEPALQVYPYNFQDSPAVRVLNLGGMTSGVVFTYFDRNGAPLELDGTNKNSISAVGIHLTATRPSQGGPVSVDFVTKVKIRALFNSLS